MDSQFSVGKTKTVGDLIQDRKEVYWVWSSTSIYVAAKHMKELHLRAIGVADIRDEGYIVGIVSHNDFSNKILAQFQDAKHLSVKNVMSTELISVKEETSIIECLGLMLEKDINHLVVFDELGEYRGLISRKDVDRACLEQLEEYAKVLHDYVSQT